MNREHIVQQAFAQGQNDGYSKRGFKCPFWWGKRRRLAYIEGYTSGARKRAYMQGVRKRVWEKKNEIHSS